MKREMRVSRYFDMSAAEDAAMDDAAMDDDALDDDAVEDDALDDDAPEIRQSIVDSATVAEDAASDSVSHVSETDEEDDEEDEEQDDMQKENVGGFIDNEKCGRRQYYHENANDEVSPGDSGSESEDELMLEIRETLAKEDAEKSKKQAVEEKSADAMRVQDKNSVKKRKRLRQASSSSSSEDDTDLK